MSSSLTRSLALSLVIVWIAVLLKCKIYIFFYSFSICILFLLENFILKDDSIAFLSSKSRPQNSESAERSRIRDAIKQVYAV